MLCALVAISGEELKPGMDFGLRLTVHATRTGPRNVISYSEQLVDGTIAAFHNDRYSNVLLTALAPKFPGVTDELRRALECPLGTIVCDPGHLCERWLRTDSVRPTSAASWAN